MDKVLVPVRDLTDPDQNQAVLDAASALAEDPVAVGRVTASHGPAVAAEASAAARSRRRLGEHLDAGQAGLVVVGVSDMGAKIERAMKKAEKVESKQLKADTAEIEADAKSAEG